MPSDELVDDTDRLWLMRGASAGVTLLALYAIFAYVSPSGWVLIFFAVFLGLMLPGIGDLMSIFTLWAGYGITSCPNCPEFAVEKIEVEEEQCDWCGDTNVHLAAPFGASGPRRYKNGVRYEYCSRSCSDAHRNVLGNTTGDSSE